MKKIIVPLEIRIEFPSSGEKKDKKLTKKITKWISDDLKNMYIPLGEPKSFGAEIDTARITRIRIGKLL